MTGTCRWCGIEIMKVGEIWYLKRAADINGFCPNSPTDLHSPKPLDS
jgi:hypothetical protein